MWIADVITLCANNSSPAKSFFIINSAQAEWDELRLLRLEHWGFVLQWRLLHQGRAHRSRRNQPTALLFQRRGRKSSKSCRFLPAPCCRCKILVCPIRRPNPAFNRPTSSALIELGKKTRRRLPRFKKFVVESAPSATCRR